MTSMTVTLEQVLEWCKDILRNVGPINAIETGCSWSWKEEELPYLSTPNIIKTLIAPTGGKLYSLDNDLRNIDICRAELQDLGLDEYVEFIYGDSVRSIADLAHVMKGSVHFVWHDSAEDSDHALAEFMAVQRLLDRNRGHVICVDDFGSATSKKWQAISSALYSRGYFISTYNTPTGLIVGHI